MSSHQTGLLALANAFWSSLLVLQRVALLSLRNRRLMNNRPVILDRRLLPEGELLILIERPQRAAISLLHVELHALVRVLQFAIYGRRRRRKVTRIVHSRRLLRFEKERSHFRVFISYNYTNCNFDQFN